MDCNEMFDRKSAQDEAGKSVGVFLLCYRNHQYLVYQYPQPHPLCLGPEALWDYPTQGEMQMSWILISNYSPCTWHVLLPAFLMPDWTWKHSVHESHHSLRSAFASHTYILMMLLMQSCPPLFICPQKHMPQFHVTFCSGCHHPTQKPFL